MDASVSGRCLVWVYFVSAPSPEPAVQSSSWISLRKCLCMGRGEPWFYLHKTVPSGFMTNASETV